MLDKPSWNSATAEVKLAVIDEHWTRGGQPASYIAALFSDASRNAVIGFIHRRKLQRPAPYREPKTKPPTAPRESKPKAKPVRNHSVNIGPPSTSAALEDEATGSRLWDLINNNRPPLPGCPPMPILALPWRAGEVCRFPVQGGACGAATHDGKPYCPTHYALAYKPAPPRGNKKAGV